MNQRQRPCSPADASLALWALAWQPSNRAVAVEVVVAPLIVLYREGGEAGGHPTVCIIQRKAVIFL